MPRLSFNDPQSKFCRATNYGNDNCMSEQALTLLDESVEFICHGILMALLYTRPLISFRTTPCCELRKVKETSGGPEGDSKSVHTKGKGVGLSEI